MGFFYISVPWLSNSKEATHREINDVVLKKSIADGKEVFLDLKKFKLANLDTLMMVNDKLLKLQGSIESFLKRIDRQYLDLQEKASHDWYVKFQNNEIAISKYLTDFKWNDAKYPRTYPLNRIVETIEAKANNYQSQLKNKTNSYNETKAQLTQNTQKEGNYYVRDLTDLLVEPNVSAHDFQYTKFLTTLIVVVPIVVCDEFEKGYWTISNYVVPRSAKRLNVPEKDGLTIWKISIFTEKLEEEQNMREHDDDDDEDNQHRKKKEKKNQTPVQEFIEKAREKFKVSARQFKFQLGLADQRKKKKNDLEGKLKSQNKAVSDLCLAFFAQAYELYVHAKMVRLVVEKSMRFGSDPTAIYLIETSQGKQKNVLSLLTDIFAQKDNDGGDELMYGTKDEINDSEDFFPFIYIPCIVI